MKYLYQYIFVIFGLITLSNLSFAESNVYSCVNKETGFTTTFHINFSGKTIKHLTSFSPDSNKKFSVNQDIEILTFNRNWAVSIGMSNENKILNLKVFDFVNKTYTNSGHYLDEVKKPFPQLFTCVSS